MDQSEAPICVLWLRPSVPSDRFAAILAVNNSYKLVLIFLYCNRTAFPSPLLSFDSFHGLVIGLLYEPVFS